MSKKEHRFFAQGEEVRIAKKSKVVDKDRRQEGVSSEEAPREINQDVTGEVGAISASPYESPLKDGEYCVPITLRDGSVVGVPEDRLERTSGSIVSRWSRSFAAGWERIFGKKK